MVGPDAQHMVGLLLSEPARKPLPAAHRIEGYDAAWSVDGHDLALGPRKGTLHPVASSRAQTRIGVSCEGIPFDSLGKCAAKPRYTNPSCLDYLSVGG